MLRRLAQQIEKLLKEKLDRQPALREELSWFFQEPGQLQFFDALRVISESSGGFETVYDLGRRIAKMTIPEVQNRPGMVLEIGSRKLESMIEGFKVQVKKLGYGKAEIFTSFAQEGQAGGWAFCRFVEGWLLGAVEQSGKERVSSSKTACVTNRGRFHFSDGELKVGPGKEVIFYPKESRTPKMVGKRASSGRFKFRGIRFGEKNCAYRVSWAPSPGELLTALGLRPYGEEAHREFSAALEKIEEDLCSFRENWEQAASFHSALLEFMRASSTITSTQELWEGVARCAHSGIGFDRVAVFEIELSGLKHIYYWDVEGRAIKAESMLEIEPRSPEAKAIREGRSMAVSNLEHPTGLMSLLSKTWLSPGFIIVPLGEPPGYTHLLWADVYRKKRSPDTSEAGRMDIVAYAASLALSKLESIEKLEERVEERTQAQHELTQKLNQLYREVRDFETTKTQILSVVGHELKTPLNSILGLSQILLKEMDGPLTFEQRQDMEAILKSAEHLFSLIGDILDLSRLESKRLKLRIHAVDLSEILRETAMFIAPQAREKGLIFEPLIPRYFKAEADAKRISQVVTNLCTNAIKHTETGKVKLTLTEEAGEAIIAVEDSGPGIPEPLREKIFEPFYQIGKEKRGGLGLGLAISKRLVELHGGTIEVDKSEGGGAKFQVRLPRWQNEPV